MSHFTATKKFEVWTEVIQQSNFPCRPLEHNSFVDPNNLGDSNLDLFMYFIEGIRVVQIWVHEKFDVWTGPKKP